MNDTIKLIDPEPMDWDKFNPSSKWTPPPPALGPDGKPIFYTVQLPTDLSKPERFGATDEGYRRYDVGPLKFVKNGGMIDGTEIRFYSVSVKKFRNRKTNEPMEVSSAGKLIRSAGIVAKPQRNEEYDQAIRQASGRVITITIDWKAKNKDTGETVEGYVNFPIDPKTGLRKAILEQGDVLPDGRQIVSERLFANAVVRNVIDRK